jgi:hypothetical protein
MHSSQHKQFSVHSKEWSNLHTILVGHHTIKLKSQFKRFVNTHFFGYFIFGVFIVVYVFITILLL